MIKTFCEQPFALQDSHVVQHVETRLLSQYAIRPCGLHVHTLARCCTPLLNARTGCRASLHTYILTLAFAAPGQFKLVITALLAATHHPLPPHPLVPHVPILCPTEKYTVVPLPVSGDTRLTADRLSPSEGARCGAKHREIHRTCVVPSGSKSRTVQAVIFQQHEVSQTRWQLSMLTFQNYFHVRPFSRFIKASA
jgi:hypothetical protein